MARERVRLTGEVLAEVISDIASIFDLIDEIVPRLSHALRMLSSGRMTVLPSGEEYIYQHLDLLIAYAQSLELNIHPALDNILAEQGVEAAIEDARDMRGVTRDLQAVLRMAIYNLIEQMGSDNYLMLFVMVEQYGHEASLAQVQQGSIEYFIHRLEIAQSALSETNETTEVFIGDLLQGPIVQDDSDEDQTEEEAKEDQIEENQIEDEHGVLEEGQVAQEVAVELQALNLGIEVVGDIVAQNPDCNCSM